MFKKSHWPGILLTSTCLTVALAWMQRVDSTLPQKLPTPTPEAVQVALPTETWRVIVLPTPTPWPTEHLIVIPRPPATPSPTPEWFATAPCGCSYDAYDCADFKDTLGNVSVEGAQICFNYCLDQTGGDPHRLIQDVPWDAYINTAWVCTDGRIAAESGE